MEQTALKFLTPKQIAAELGVNCEVFVRKLREGKGPKFKRYGTRYLIRTDWYKSWIESNEPKG